MSLSAIALRAKRAHPFVASALYRPLLSRPATVVDMLQKQMQPAAYASTTVSDKSVKQPELNAQSNASSSSENDWISHFAAEKAVSSETAAHNAASPQRNASTEFRKRNLDNSKPKKHVASVSALSQLIEQDVMHVAYNVYREVVQKDKKSLANLSPDHFAKLIGSVCFDNRNATADQSYRFRAEIAQEIFKTMKSVGVKPTEAAFGYVALTYGRLRKYEELERLIDEMREYRLNTKSIRVQQARLFAYVAAGWNDKVRQIFDELLARNDTIANYNTLMSAYAFADQEQKMLDLLEKMKAKGFEPDSRTYNCFCMFYFSRGEYDKLRELVDGIKHRMPIPTPIWNKCLIAANKIGDHQGALASLSEMRILKVPFNYSTYVEQLIAFASLNRRNKAWDLLADMLKVSNMPRDVSIAMAKMEGPATDPDVLAKITQSIRTHGLYLFSTYISFARGYTRLGDPASVRIMIAECEKISASDVEPEFYLNISRAYRYAGDVRGCLNALNSTWNERSVPATIGDFYALMLTAMKSDSDLIKPIKTAFSKMHPNVDVNAFVKTAYTKYESNINETNDMD